MISQLQGKVVAANLTNATVMIGGVGFQVNLPLRISSQIKIGEEISLFTYLAVREDALTLYGFDSQYDCEIFTTLQTVSGIGPKAALSAVSIYDAGQIYEALASNDQNKLEKIP